jgi:hypothetical protein
MLGLTIVLLALWAFGVINLPRLLVGFAEELKTWGILPLVVAILLAYAIKGRLTLFPSFGAITVNCALLPFWLALLVAVVGHMFGQTICWYWGPASHRKNGKQILPWLKPEKTWHMIAAYFLIPQTDVALMELRAKKHMSDTRVLLSGLPFIVIADVILILGSKQVLAFLKTLI